MKSISLSNSFAAIIFISALTACNNKNFEIGHEAPSGNEMATTVEWTDLLPKEDLNALENPPAYITETEEGGVSDTVQTSLKNHFPGDAIDAYQQALVSKNTRPEFNNKLIRIAGFAVPLELSAAERITSLLLVPYFGACLHIPPPPPNQIIYVQFKSGLPQTSLDTPLWVEGRITTEMFDHELASSAYSLEATSIEIYSE